MAKEFVEFKNEDQVATLELSAYALSSAEHKAVRAELTQLYTDQVVSEGAVELLYIDADSLRVQVRDEYDAVVKIMDRLEADGWTWGGKADETES